LTIAADKEIYFKSDVTNSENKNKFQIGKCSYTAVCGYVVLSWVFSNITRQDYFYDISYNCWVFFCK